MESRLGQAIQAKAAPGFSCHNTASCVCVSVFAQNLHSGFFLGPQEACLFCVSWNCLFPICDGPDLAPLKKAIKPLSRSSIRGRLSERPLGFSCCDARFPFFIFVLYSFILCSTSVTWSFGGALFAFCCMPQSDLIRVGQPYKSNKCLPRCVA